MLYSYVIDFVYDENNQPYAMRYNGTVYYYVLNVQGDVVGLLNASGAIAVEYTYDPWGKLLNIKTWGDLPGEDEWYLSVAEVNPLRYRGYYYDTETGFYNLQTRYYDPAICRFINADNQLSAGGNLTGLNLFAYCGNNPVNMIDPTGEAWWHWALGALVVVACAAATVVTCGGSLAAAATAVGMVASGGTAFTTASTVAAGAFIGSSAVYGMTALSAASTSSSVKEFNDKGNWGTVAATAGGAIIGGGSAYFSTISSGKGFDTYNQLKKEIGSPGDGRQWHHIVEQCQITKSGFSPQSIQNTNNIISLSKTTHSAISGYYSSIQPFTNGMTVRNWLVGQSFDAQRKFGLNVIKMFT